MVGTFKKTSAVIFACIVLPVLVLLLGFPSLGQSDRQVFYTNQGSGPDKWASVWYLSEVLNHKVKLLNAEELLTVDKTPLFDVPAAEYNRTANSTTFESLLTAMPASDSAVVVIELQTYIKEIEIDAWSGDVTIESKFIEQGFRNMQLRYGRSAVTRKCYMRFFDTVADNIGANKLSELSDPNSLIPSDSCMTNADINSKSSVESMPLDKVLELIATNNHPLFIDTRETLEFDEGHVPGAINLKLRDIDELTAEKLADVELAIAYCVKDFRGYEMARKLRSLGVNAAIMTPHGMRGWVSAGLPVAGERGDAEEVAMEELLDLARESVRPIQANEI